MSYPQWRWHLDEVFVKVNGKLCYPWRAVDHEGEVLEAVATAKRDKAAALKLLKRIIKKYGAPRSIVIDGLRGHCHILEVQAFSPSWARSANSLDLLNLVPTQRQVVTSKSG